MIFINTNLNVNIYTSVLNTVKILIFSFIYDKKIITNLYNVGGMYYVLNNIVFKSFVLLIKL